MSTDRTPNVRLRAAREALELTRQQLSTALEAHAQAMGVDFACDPTKVRRWEMLGMTPRDYAQEVLIDFFAQFGYGPADLGLPVPIAQRLCTSGAATPTVSEKAVSSAEDDEVKRRQLAAGAAALAGLPVLGSLAPPVIPPVPERVGPAEIEQIRGLTAMLAALDESHGGELVQGAVIPRLRWASQLLSVPSGELRDELFRVVAALASVAGFAMFDAYEHTNARTTFTFGAACAEEAGDWNLRAEILSSMARQATWIGDPDRALTYIELARVRSDRLTHTERAVLSTVRARALARLGREQETLREISEADAAASRSNPAEDPPHVAYYDRAQHLGETGQALADLAVKVPRARTGAQRRLSAAVACHTDHFARARALSEIRLASLAMLDTTGDPHEAASVGHRALDAITTLHSPRVHDYLRELSAHAAAHSKIAEVSRLRHRIGLSSG